MSLLVNVFILKSVKYFSTSTLRYVKVAVLGASGGIGQPLSLLIKQTSIVSHLSLYDIAHTPGVATDLSHINIKSETVGYNGPANLEMALKKMNIVVISAGVPRKPGMTRDDLFTTNASVVRDLIDACATHCPKSFIAIITNPLNSTVPIAAEVLKKHGVFDPNKLFGITTLDVVRTSTFVGQMKGINPAHVRVPIIGGHSGVTIVPVLSQTKPQTDFKDEEVRALIPRIQEAGTKVVKAKAGEGSATLSMAFAGARFVSSLARAYKGEKNIVECSYVSSNVVPEVSYFSTPLLLGHNGVEKNLGLPKLNDFETQLVKKACSVLKKNIQKGEEFITKK